MSDDLERRFADDDARARRRFTLLVTGSVASGVLAFAVTIVLSQLLLPPEDGSSVSLGPAVLALGALFAVLIALCIVLGYVAARTRPPHRG